MGARGARVRFEELGQGAPLLLLHDALSSRLAWADVAPRLAESSRVVMPDLPGFGESEKPPPSRYPYRAEGLADSMLDLIAALGESRLSICGHGLGASVGLAIAANHPELVERLVLVSPVVYGTPLGPLSRLARLPLVGRFAFKQLSGYAAFAGHFRERVYGSRFQPPSGRVERYFEAFNSPAGREAAHATLYGSFDARTIVARLSRVLSPVLVVSGRADSPHAVHASRKLARQLTRARFEVLDSAQSPAEETPEAFADLVTDFLQSARGGA